MYQTIEYQVADKICTLTLNRPDRFNAFNEEMSKEFMEALKAAEKDPEVRVIILTGAGKAFCSGQDLKDIAGQKRSLADSIERRYNPMIKKVTGIEKPIICKLNGIGAGAGASLALACDMIIASEDSALLEAFVNIGLVPDSGSSYFLPRLVGRQKAFEIAALGDKISAVQAAQLGLVNQVVPATELDAKTLEIAQRFATGATKAIGMIKRMLNRSFESSLDEMLEQEKYCQEIAGNSKDYQEGVTAFTEKRKPNFTGA
jgi:2-(1,2-epoxy-1,2-dihydrophenyl)acetyl-CoA isomerase